MRKTALVLILFLACACQVSAPAPSYPPASVSPPHVDALVLASATPRPSPATRLTRTASPSPTPRATVARTVQAAKTESQPPMPSRTARPSQPPGTVWISAGQVTVPVLLYHNISDRGSTRYIVRVETFRQQMNALREAGYQAVTISELAQVIRGGGYLPEKPVAITFDDGYRSVHQNAFPVLQELGFRATVYVISGTLEPEQAYGYLREEELDDLVGAGWEVGSHTISHSNLKTTPLGLRNEIETSRLDLEEKLGVPVRSFSYPFNISNAWIRERVEQYGYESAVGVDIFITHTPERLYFLSRREVLRSTGLAAFKDLLKPGAFETSEGALAPPPQESGAPSGIQ